MIKHLVKGVYRGFSGGPDFNYQQTLRFELEDKLLSVTVPCSNVTHQPNEQPNKYFFRAEGWFEKHSKQDDFQHQVVHINTKVWMYVPVIPIGTSSEYGMLSFSLRIARLSKIGTFSAFNSQALAKHVIEDYHMFHNGPVNTELRAGRNTQILTELTAFESERATRWTKEYFEEALKKRIDKTGFVPLEPAKVLVINQKNWVFYSEIKGISRSHKDYYCLALDDNHYLECEFSYRVDRNDKYKKWKKAALEAKTRIMDSIIITSLDNSPMLTDEAQARDNKTIDMPADDYA